MKTLPILLAALMLASNASAQSRPNYSPEYIAQIDQNLQRFRGHCAKLEVAKREPYDDKRLIAMLRVLESYGADADAGKIDATLLEAARKIGRVTQADLDCTNTMTALVAYVVRKCQTDPGSCTYE